MGNDQQNHGNKSKQHTLGRQPEQEGGTTKQGARAQGKEGKVRKGKALDQDRNPGRTMH